MKSFFIVLLLSSIAFGQQISPDQSQCYTLTRLNELGASPAITNGMFACCSDCNPGTCPCTDGGTGSMATRQGSTWSCSGCNSFTTTTIPMPGCEDVGNPCGGCGDGICLPRCDGGSCSFICVSVVGSPCDSAECLVAGPTAVCVDSMPFGCVDGVCDSNRECGFPCFGSVTTTTTSTTTIATTTTTTIATTTTTGAGSTTTSTTVTTTTTTTTTTEPTFIADNYIWAPVWPSNRTDSDFPINNKMVCNAWVPPIGLSEVRTLSIFVTANTGDRCGVAIYNDDGSSRLVTTGDLDCSGGFSTHTATGLSGVTLNPGTKYLICFCSTATSLSFPDKYSGVDPGPSNGLLSIQNSLSGAISFKAGTDCTAGAPATTTGTLTPSTTNTDGRPINPITILLGTNTP